MSPGALFESYGRWIARHRGVGLALIAALTAVAGWSIVHHTRDGLPVDFTPQAIFQDNGAQQTRMAEIEEVFGRDDNDLVAILAGPIGTPEGVEAIRSLHAAAEGHPQVERVQSLVGAQVTDDADGMLTPVALLDELSPEAAVSRAAEDPVLSGLVVGARGDAAALRIRLDEDRERVADLEPTVREVESLLRTVELPPGLELHITGVPFVRVEVVDRMLTEQQTLFPMVALTFIVTICLLFRSIRVGLAPLVAVGVAITWVMGVLLAGGAVFNILSILVPTLVLVIGVADGIHVVGRFREDLAVSGDRAEAMGSTLRHMAGATFLTTFTTGAGFSSLMVADTLVIKDFGLHAGIAMVLCWFAMMLTLPTVLAYVPVERVGKPPTRSQSMARALGATDSLVRRRPRPVLLVSLAAVVLAAWTARDVRTNSALLELYPDDHPTSVAIHLAQDRLAGVVPIQAHFQGPPGSLKDPVILGKILAYEEALAAEDSVRWTGSIASFLRSLHHKLTDEHTLPATRAAVAQELLLAELSGEVPLSGLITPDDAQARILGLIDDAGGREVVAMKARMDAVGEELFADTEVEVTLTGDGILASVGVDQLIGDLLSSVGLVFAIILVTMWVLLREVRLALVAALPNLVPLIFALAMLGLMGSDLQTSNIVTFTVAVGLAVDDTIHFIVRFKQERDSGRPFQEAMTRTFHGAGHAIWLTSALLVLGFAALTTSDLTSTRHFGILSSTAMVAALLGDLFLLPALLWLVVGRRR